MLIDVFVARGIICVAAFDFVACSLFGQSYCQIGSPASYKQTGQSIFWPRDQSATIMVWKVNFNSCNFATIRTHGDPVRSGQQTFATHGSGHYITQNITQKACSRTYALNKEIQR